MAEEMLNPKINKQLSAILDAREKSNANRNEKLTEMRTQSLEGLRIVENIAGIEEIIRYSNTKPMQVSFSWNYDGGDVYINCGDIYTGSLGWAGGTIIPSRKLSEEAINEYFDSKEKNPHLQESYDFGQLREIAKDGEAKTIKKLIEETERVEGI